MKSLLNNYRKVVWRNLGKQPGLSGLNLMGLLIGTTVSLMIFTYVLYESNYDTFQPNYRQLYRIASQHHQNGEMQRETAFTVPALGPTVAEQIPGIQDYFRLTAWAQSYTLTANSKSAEQVIFKEKNGFFADPGVLDHLGLDLVQGDPERALREPREMILSAATASKYYGTDWKQQDLLGKTVEYHDDYHGTQSFTIAGVFQNYPANSHLAFDILFSHSSLPLFLPEEIPPKQRAEMFDVSWGPPSWYTYVVLSESVDVTQVKEGIDNLLAERNSNPENKETVLLQNIAGIHLHSNLQDEPREPGSQSQIEFLAVIGVLLLLATWINYINLAVVKASHRAKEVALRKVFSASRSQLVQQFVTEAFILNLIVLLLASGLLGLMYPLFADYLELSSDFTLNIPQIGWLLAGLLLIATLATGLYPAWHLFNSPAISTLKSARVLPRNSAFKGLALIIQLGVTLLLMVTTTIAVTQINYMRNQGAGVQIERTVVIEAPNVLEAEDSFENQVETLRGHLGALTGIESVTSADFIPGSPPAWNIQAARLNTPDQTQELKQITVDREYLATIKIPLVTGKSFSDYPNLEDKVVLNRRAAQVLGFGSPEEAINQTVKIFHGGWTPELQVVGVVENYHHRSLNYSYEPIAFFSNPSNGHILIQLTAANTEIKTSLASIRAAWEEVFPGNPFDYYFLDDHYQQQYRSDRQFTNASRLGSGVALIIAFTGLVAFVSFTTLRKRKEISIRKVLGASVNSILLLLSRRILVFTLIAFMVSIPLTYWLVRQWLENYAFHIDLRSQQFMLPALAIVIFVLVTMSYHTLKSAYVNPTRSLREE